VLLVLDVLTAQSSQVVFIDDDHVIEEARDEPFPRSVPLSHSAKDFGAPFAENGPRISRPRGQPQLRRIASLSRTR